MRGMRGWMETHQITIYLVATCLGIAAGTLAPLLVWVLFRLLPSRRVVQFGVLLDLKFHQWDKKVHQPKLLLEVTTQSTSAFVFFTSTHR